MGKTIIGSARIDENGHATGGKRGDQKQTSVPDYSGEVSMQEFYVSSKGWYVLRPKSPDYAAKIAAFMVTACNNKNIGYSQNDRASLSKVSISTKSPANSDCSSLVRQCVAEATGKKISFFSTADEVAVLEATGLFEKHFGFTSSTRLQAGDVLVTKVKGHTAIVVSTDGEIPDGAESAGGGSGSSTGSDSDSYGTGLGIQITDETELASGNSSLVGYKNRLSTSENSPRPVPISCITIHIAKARASLDKLATMMKSSKTSYNYGIDSDGTIGLFVDESYASTGTGTEDHDARTVNIVCANSTLSPSYEITTACYNSLVDLCEDICRRRYIFQLAYSRKNPDTTTLTFHFQVNSSVEQKDCPGDYLFKKRNDLISTVNNRLNTVNRQRVSVTSWQADSEAAALRAQSTVDLGAVHPYIARIGHDATGVNYQGLVNSGVVGLMLYGGAYYDDKRSVREAFEDIHLNTIIKDIEKSKTRLPYAISYKTRAISVAEAKRECKGGLYYVLSKYRPKLGVWVECSFVKGSIPKAADAAAIIDIYYQYFVEWGFKSKCGIIATKEMAKLIGWPAQAAYMPLWLQGEMDENIAPKDEVLTPSYFKLDDLTNKGFNKERDAASVQSTADQLRGQYSGSGGGGSSSTGYVDGTESIGTVDRSSPKVGVKTTVPEPSNDSAVRGKYRTIVTFEFPRVDVNFGSIHLSTSGWPYAAMKATSKQRFNKDGIMYFEIGGERRYAAAFTPKFGGDGALVNLHMSSGETLKFVVVDIKGADAGNTWGHNNGLCVTELFVSTQRKQGYQYVGGTAGSYPVAFTIMGYIKKSDLN